MKSKYLLALLIVGTMFTACDDDDDTPPAPPMDNEEEVITTLNYTLTPMGGGNAVVFSFQDLDGDGGNAPTITGDTLEPNATYTGSIELLNETETPAEDITAEVKEEDEEHQLFYTSSTTNVAFSYADMDENNLPVGLMTTVATQGSGSSLVTVTLRHEPNKTASGVSSGDITNAGGETDIEVDFTFVVR